MAKKKTLIAGDDLTPKSNPTPKSKILIADDNPTNVELLEAYLSEIACEIAVATDGRDTLDKVAEFQPDLILLDMQLPVMEGHDVARALRRMERYYDVPIIAITAYDMASVRWQSLQAGCTVFLNKPINTEALLDILGAYLPRPVST